MSRRFRPFLALFLLTILGVALAPSQRTAASDLALPYTGYGVIDGAVRLEVLVSPPVSMPGQTLTLELRLSDATGAADRVGVTVRLPDSVSLDRDFLPTGATLNLQTRELMWLPSNVQIGETQSVSTQLRVETAQVTNPEQVVDVAIRIDDDERRLEVPIWIGIPPQLNRILNPPQVAVGQPVQLRADVTGSGPMAQSWSLGDGRQVNVQDPSVVYPAPGIYRVTVEVANPLTVDSMSKSITVVPHPAAQFTADDFSPGVGQAIQFTSLSGGQPPLEFAWDFGDGTTSDIAQPIHQYAAPGNYLVRLAVENAIGVSEAFYSVVVGVPPTADMIIPDSVPSGMTVLGRAFGDETVNLFTWDTGDGRVYQGEKVSYLYRRVGDFYVSMRASNDFGSTEIGRWIHVSNGLSWVYLPTILSSNLLEGLGVEDPLADPFAVELEPVLLDEAFVMEALPEAERASQSDQLLLYINEARRLFELPPLRPVHELNVSAKQHTDDMAQFHYAAHSGSDGSFPAERLLFNAYGSAYAGEATAWGFEHAYQAVEFWVNSPSHRRIILNRFATDVGVGYTVDFTAPNVWYWTAEFGNGNAPAAPARLRLDAPPAEVTVELSNAEERADLPLITDSVAYSWNWPLPLHGTQRFVVYLAADGKANPLAIVSAPRLGTRYVVEVPAYPTALDITADVEVYEWLVKLEDSAGRILAESERRSIMMAPDPSLQQPIVDGITPTPASTPTPTVTPTPTPTVAAPAPTSRPEEPTPPVFITATPLPTAEP